MLLVVYRLSRDVIGCEDSLTVIGAFQSVFLSQLNSVFCQCFALNFSLKHRVNAHIIIWIHNLDTGIPPLA